MDQDRRRELRQARRERRQAEQRAVGTNGGGAGTAGAGGGGGRRRLFRAAANQSEGLGSANRNTNNMDSERAPGGTQTGGRDTNVMAGMDPTTMSMAMTPQNANSSHTDDARLPVATSAASGRRRVASRRNDAARLTEKMNQKKRKAASKAQQLTAREAHVQDTYAPNIRELLLGLSAGDDAEDAAAVAAATTPAMMSNTITGFDKDDLLATRIRETQANFLKLDQGLSEDHALATQQLHSAVFAHANDFLLLFRDVERASRLVEALKSNVQGTKTAISAMSKFTFADVGSTRKTTSSSASGPSGMRHTGARGTSSAALLMPAEDVSMGATSVHGRVSLITERERALTPHANDRGDVEVMLANQLAHAHHDQEPRAPEASLLAADTNSADSAGLRGDDGGAFRPRVSSASGGNGGYRVAATASRATTRALNVASLQQWRLMMGAPVDILSTSAVRARASSAMAATTATALAAKRGTSAADRSALDDLHKDAEARSREIDMFVALVREQLTQLLSERRHAEAAETLRDLADEANRRGCLPLLLDLETDLVRSVLQNLAHVPQSPILHESAQVPLIQLLLQFGRVKAGVSVFLALQTPWIQSELLTLQSRVANPTRVCWIAADYLVQLMRHVLRRQQTLLHPTAEAHKISASLDAAAAATNNASAGTSGNSKSKTTSNNNNPTLEALTEKLQRENKLVPPNSTALLWVRQNMELFAVRVLAAQVLSYGTGTDGGDPSRVRRAAVMTSESIRVLETISAQGSGATVASLTLRLLTPSLVLLETEFSRLTTTRFDNSGRAMAEQVITNALLMYETSAAIYQPSKADDAVRKGNARCQWLEARLSGVLPRSAHGWLVQLFLSPATTSLFVKAANSTPNAGGEATPVPGSSSSSRPPTKPHMPTPLFPPERYRFVRYANGCTVLHCLLLQSLVGFVCALGGSDDVLGSLDGDEVSRGETGSPSSSSATAASDYSTAVGRNNRSTTDARAADDSTDRSGANTGTAGASASRRRVQTSRSDPLRGAEKEGRGGASQTTTTTAASSSCESSAAARCAALLLSNALILESVDITLYRLFISFLWTSLRERQSLVAYLTSDTFVQAQQKLYPRARQAAPLPLLCDPALSPAFVFDSLSGLVADVLSTGAWISYLTRGGAMGHLLGSAQLSFRTQHLASLHAAVPGIVQGWLVCVLSLGHCTDAAVDLLPVPSSATVEEAAELAGASTHHTTPKASSVRSSTTTRARAQGTAQSDTPLSTADVTAPTPPQTTTTTTPSMAIAPGSPAVGSTLLKRSFGPSSMNVAGFVRGGGAVASRPTSASATVAPAAAGLRAGGTVRVQLQRRDTARTDGNASGRVEAGLPGIGGVHGRPLRLLPESAVRHVKLRALLMSVLDRPYTTPSAHRAHHALPSLPSLSQRRQEVLQQREKSAGHTDTAPSTSAPTQKQAAALTGSVLAAWGIRLTIPSYPEFPIGGDFDRKDELFLLHWCAQINLHLLTLFQERLLTASHLINARATSAAKASTDTEHTSTALTRQLAELKGAAPLQRPSAPRPPLPGGVSPQEDSALAGLCGGGGNYPTAVATLQFLVLRVLRDALCQVETWTAVYDCASPAQWRQDEAILRQQLFFFALFARFWAPLFTGGATTAAAAGPRASGSPVDADQPPSCWSIDGLPALAVLERMTCGHAVFDMHTACLRRQRALAYQERRSADPSLTAAAVVAASELTEEELNAERQQHPRLHTAIDTYFDTQRASGAATGGGGPRGQGWKRDDTLRPPGLVEMPLTQQEATRILLGRSGPYVPDTLLRVMQYFFEEQLGETRAVLAITSDAMRNRVDKAMASINLLAFVGSSLGDEDSDAGEGDGSDRTASSGASSQRSSKTSRTSATTGPTAPVTLMNLRDLLEFYLQPLR